LKEQLSDFDKEYEREKRKKNTIIAACFVGALAFCVLIVYLSLPDNIPKTLKIQGTMTSLTSVLTENGETPATKVTLDNGQEITVFLSKSLVFKQDSKIELKKVTSTAGIDAYHFIKYVQ
jgi:hypothetical protein